MTREIEQAVVDNATARAIDTRRDLHKHAELGLIEFRTASLVAQRLKACGLEVALGRDVMDASQVYGLPEDHVVDEGFARALDEGADRSLIEQMRGGCTGVVGILDSGKPGPTVALRADMDALPIVEDDSREHAPAHQGFRSIHTGVMHACGHDAHTAVGLAVAEILAASRDQLAGRVKFIFQPAEEGGRGSLPMTARGMVDDVDHFVAIHVGVGVPSGTLCPAVTGHLASEKWDVTFEGKAAHAGGWPDQGANAVLAAANAVVGLYGISRHRAGRTRINVGVMTGGSGRNVIADRATLVMELRGETQEILDYLTRRGESVIQGAALAQDVGHHIRVVGKTTTASSDAGLARRIAEACASVPGLEIRLDPHVTGGSEDATFMMHRVQQRGGDAIYCAIGSDLPSGHHTPRFDIQEADLGPAIQALATSLLALSQGDRP